MGQREAEKAVLHQRVVAPSKRRVRSRRRARQLTGDTFAMLSGHWREEVEVADPYRLQALLWDAAKNGATAERMNLLLSRVISLSYELVNPPPSSAQRGLSVASRKVRERLQATVADGNSGKTTEKGQRPGNSRRLRHRMAPSASPSVMLRGPSGKQRPATAAASSKHQRQVAPHAVVDVYTIRANADNMRSFDQLLRLRHDASAQRLAQTRPRTASTRRKRTLSRGERSFLLHSTSTSTPRPRSSSSRRRTPSLLRSPSSGSVSRRSPTSPRSPRAGTRRPRTAASSRYHTTSFPRQQPPASQELLATLLHSPHQPPPASRPVWWYGACLGAPQDTIEQSLLLWGKALKPHQNVQAKENGYDPGIPVAALAGTGDLLIHSAAWHGHIEVLRSLVDAGVRVNVTDAFHTTPLMEVSYAALRPENQEKMNYSVLTMIVYFSDLLRLQGLGMERWCWSCSDLEQMCRGRMRVEIQPFIGTYRHCCSLFV